MNRQALAFLTMFSLILMLSVYYVTLPQDDVSVMQQETSAENRKEEKVSAAETKKKETTSKVNDAEALRKEINQKKDAAIAKYSAVVSDEKADGDEKQAALKKIDECKEEKVAQTAIAAKLKKKNIEAAAEINGTTCIVTLFDIKASKEKAAEIMKEVAAMTNQKYFIEVTFK